jgi:RNA polymerase sigma factor FliA
MGEPISPSQIDLLNRFLSSRDPLLREEIVLSYVPLVHYVLGRLGFTQELGCDYEDLVSQGVIGLIEALDHYNPSFGAQFRTYAVVRVRGKVLDYLRTLDWMTRTERKRSRSVQKAITEFWLKNQRAPSDQDLSGMVDIGIEQVQKALVDATRVIVSLDSTQDSDEEGQSLHEMVADENQPDPSEVFFHQETLLQLEQAIRDLDKQEQLILSLYYYEKLTFKEIGMVVDLSESRVCQLHARAIINLRASMQHKENPVPAPVPVVHNRKTNKELQGQPARGIWRRG